MCIDVPSWYLDLDLLAEQPLTEKFHGDLGGLGGEQGAYLTSCPNLAPCPIYWADYLKGSHIDSPTLNCDSGLLVNVFSPLQMNPAFVIFLRLKTEGGIWASHNKRKCC